GGGGAGGGGGLGADLAHSWKARALAVLVATLYTYVTLRIAGDLVLIVAPALPFTALGIVEHLTERREERRAAPTTLARDRACGSRPRLRLVAFDVLVLGDAKPDLLVPRVPDVV